MKYALVILMTWFSGIIEKDASIGLEEALRSNKYAIEITGNTSSTHYLQPLQVIIKNKSNTKVQIIVPAGMHFASVEEGIQDVITTQTMMLALKPNAQKSFPLQGVCIQSSNSGPTDEDLFTFNGKGVENLRTFALFLDEKNIQSAQGQHAMWALADNQDVESLVSVSNDLDLMILNEVLKIKGKPVWTAERVQEEKRNHEPTHRSTLRGSFRLDLSTPKQVDIALFTENNILIKEVLKKRLPAGRKTVNYEIETSQMHGQTIVSKVIVDQKVWSSRTIQIPG